MTNCAQQYDATTESENRRRKSSVNEPWQDVPHSDLLSCRNAPYVLMSEVCTNGTKMANDITADVINGFYDVSDTILSSVACWFSEHLPTSQYVVIVPLPCKPQRQAQRFTTDRLHAYAMVMYEIKLFENYFRGLMHLMNIFQRVHAMSLK